MPIWCWFNRPWLKAAYKLSQKLSLFASDLIILARKIKWDRFLLQHKYRVVIAFHITTQSDQNNYKKSDTISLQHYYNLKSKLLKLTADIFIHPKIVRKFDEQYMKYCMNQLLLLFSTFVDECRPISDNLRMKTWPTHAWKRLEKSESTWFIRHE